MNSSDEIKIFLEIGKKRTFAGAIEWPGWSRSGQDEKTSLQALLDYGKRYARIPHSAHLEFYPPVDVSAFAVVERIDGDTTTDFGTPGISPLSDNLPLQKAELVRLQSLLEACWQAFDQAASVAAGKELRLGPRGGGRTREGIIHHVQEAEIAYLGQLGVKLKKNGHVDPVGEMIQSRKAIQEALASAVRGEIPVRGPRGGLHWTPRYFVRRAAWHVLDHAWEIEDRIL